MVILETIINFRQGEQQLNQITRDYTQIAYYPIAAVPIKLWVVQNPNLSILAETLVKLIHVCGPIAFEPLMMKMNIPTTWYDMMHYEMADLLIKGLIEEEQGQYSARQSEELTTYQYEQGYMIFDAIQGKFFNYIHIGNLYTTGEEITQFQLEENVAMNRTYYDSPRCDELMHLAVHEFNEAQKHEIFTGDRAADIMTDDTAVPAEIANVRFEKQPYSFVKKGFMPIRVFVPEEQRKNINWKEQLQQQMVTVMSPFSNKESSYLREVLRHQKEGQFCIEYVLDECEQTMYDFEFDDEETVEASIIQALAQAKVSKGIYPYLYSAEKKWLDVTQSKKCSIATLAEGINGFNVVIEGILKEVLATFNIKHVTIPTAWKSTHDKDFSKNVTKAQFLSIYEQLPRALKSNLHKLVHEVIERNHIEKTYDRLSGNRDLVAFLLIVDLLHEKKWLQKIEQRVAILSELDEIVSLRNKYSSHFNEESQYMTSQQCEEKLTYVRLHTYELIRFWEVEEDEVI